MESEFNIRKWLKNFKINDPDTFNKINQSQTFPYSTMVLNIHGCLNIGNMMRTANLCGVSKFFVYGKKAYDRRSAVGSQNYTNVIRINSSKFKTHLYPEDYELDPDLFTEVIESNNLIPVFVEQGKDSKNFDTLNIRELLIETDSKELCFIFGSESYGIPENILETKSRFDVYFSIQLSQMGVINSYNVSNCYALVVNKFFNHFYRNQLDKYHLF